MAIGAIIGALGAVASSLISKGGGGGGDDGPPPGNKKLALLAELFSSTSALDAIFQNIAAREDPTIPALLNAQLSQLSDIQGGGGFDANAFLGGDFSTPAPSNPLTLGGADSPFNVPFQVAGGIDPIIQQLIDSILTPATVRQGIELGTPLTEAGNQQSLNRRLGSGGVPLSKKRLEDLQRTQQENEVIDSEQTLLLEDILGGIAQGPEPAPQSEPVLGSFQTGGIIPQTGNFRMHAGEQVIPAAAGQLDFPELRPSANVTGQGGRGDTGDQHFAFDPLPPNFEITPPGGGGDVLPPVDNPDLGGTQGTNPLQSAIQALLQLVQGGGPITPQIAQQQQLRISDTFGQQLQGSQRSVQENFGARGLGGSGIEAALGLQQGLGLQANAARASNDLAVQQALQNFQGVQGAAQGLAGASLGAGQFGLQQQAQQNQQQQSLIEFILQTLQGTFAPGSGAQTLNIV